MTLHAQNDVRLYIHVSLRRAHEEQGLMPKHLVEVLRELAIDDGTAELLERGYERYFAMDGISACHVLVPRVEDILRHELRQLGVEATQYQPGDDATSSRTDDVTFGTLLYRNAADGRSVRDILGGPLFEYLRALFIEPVSLNLRNEFAHGLARPQDCNPATVAIVTHVLLCLVALKRSGGDHEGRHGEATSTVPLSPALPEEPR